MVTVSEVAGAFKVRAYRGDAKTLLAFDLATDESRKNLAGFTIRVSPPGVPAYYLYNTLRFEHPGDHAQDPSEPPVSTINAPLHKFRWVHVPGSSHQGPKPAFGLYAYEVTPRYFDANHKLKAIDPALGVKVEITVDRFVEGALKLGFTRGYTQSQAFVHNFDASAPLKPKKAGLVFDTSAVAGTNPKGVKYTYADAYAWLGFTARQCIFEVLGEVEADPGLSLEVFAYDLNEPDIVAALLKLAPRTRIILDDAALHHDKNGPPAGKKPKPEDEFAAQFATAAAAAGPDQRIKRGMFGRYAHDKVLIVSDAMGPKKVLTGSTNMSVTGLYVNSNHVLVFDDRAVAKLYADVFKESWDDDVDDKAFAASALAQAPFPFATGGFPNTSITFSPHKAPIATSILQGLVDRVDAEAQVPDGKGSVLFAVMQLDGGKINPVYTALNALHEKQTVFSFGVSDTPQGIALYPVGSKTGVLVTGKPGPSQLPPPFDQVPGVGLGHQIHHKFVVCGFNGDDPIVYCGSSNLALAGEEVNGDNLLAIRDADVATVFAVEAVSLVDHFNFLDRLSPPKNAQGDAPPPPANKTEAADQAGWFLGVTDAWAAKYFDPGDLHCVDRRLFAG